jgi:hypothetical protein
LRHPRTQSKNFIFSLLLTAFTLSFPFHSRCLADDFVLKQVTSYVRTPQALADWLTKDFHYEFEVTDTWQTPEQTLKLKKGDCEDFAILASAILNQLGIPNNVVIVRFKDLKISHAICTFKDKGGRYNFISNRKLYCSEKDRLQDAIAKFYPDWRNIIYIDPHKGYRPLQKIITCLQN